MIQQPILASPQREPFMQPRDAGEPLWFLDNLLLVKSSGRDGAPFSLIEARLPAGSRAPLHRHHGEDEAFYVLGGGITFFLEGDRKLRATAGSYAHVPAGTVHGFRVESELKMLVLTGPNGFVSMARAAGVAAPRCELPPSPPRVDLPHLERIAREHHIEILGPLPE